MKVASWNINGILQRLDLLTGWLEEAKPDVLCLQELKCAAAQFPADALEAASYGAVWRAEGRWNGVAILARGGVPVLTRSDLPGDAADAQARYIEAAVAGRIVVSIYVPNGNPMPGPKYEYKLSWMDRLTARACALTQSGAPVILAGDFNVALTSGDIYQTRSYDDSALTAPACRDKLHTLLAAGYVDAYRRLHPDTPGYTFWDYRRRRWDRDAGLRLDYLLLNDLAALGLETFSIERAMRGANNPSDHAPIWAYTA